MSEDIDDALEKLIVGPEKKGALISERKRRLVAYHEVRLLLMKASPLLMNLRVQSVVACAYYCTLPAPRVPPPTPLTANAKNEK